MRAGIIEIVGLFLVVAGAGGMVAAAATVSTGLAVLVASFFILLGGVIAIYISSQLAKLDKAQKPAASQ